MTEKTMTEKNTSPGLHWAAEVGRQVAERRAAHQAAAAAEHEASGQRAAVPAAELARRFAEVAVAVVEAVRLFADAAGIDVEHEPPTPGSIQLRAGDDQLTLIRQDDAVHVAVRARSHGDAYPIDLGDDDFDADAIARRIAEQFIKQLSVTHGGANVHAQ